MVQSIFTILITAQFLAVELHDWCDIRGWTHGRQVRAVLGRNKVLIGTLINGIFPGLAAGCALYYRGKPVPGGVRIYWVIYCAVTAVWAITAWWIPYFRGTNQQTAELYAKMYAGTYQVLPARGDNPRPNLLHLYFHALFLTNLVLACVLWLRIA